MPPPRSSSPSTAFVITGTSTNSQSTNVTSSVSVSKRQKLENGSKECIKQAALTALNTLQRLLPLLEGAAAQEEVLVWIGWLGYAIDDPEDEIWRTDIGRSLAENSKSFWIESYFVVKV
jgi:hypothetical protein